VPSTAPPFDCVRFPRRTVIMAKASRLLQPSPKAPFIAEMQMLSSHRMLTGMLYLVILLW
jgi:hypothetical protein